MTLNVSKQLLPIYDKPMIYYPLATLMQAGIQHILIICTARDLPLFQTLLGRGQQWGIHLEYAIQEQANGIAESLLIAEDFLAGHGCALVLGDNLFYGENLAQIWLDAASQHVGAHVFAYHVANPQDYGVVSFNQQGVVISIQEKPKAPKSQYAMPGLYFFDSQAVEYAKGIQPSSRGELEIVDVITQYMNTNQLTVSTLGRGVAWLDTGTPDALSEATQFVAAIEKRQGLKINCPEEVAFRQGWIDGSQLMKLAKPLLNSGYGEYLESLVRKQRRL